jgi:UDP-N-acetylglucosamine--N-acetylmuramyl-(pentapeptide) pyrophosphoryl-undecaprenol N-acetylglucosamine transferase
MTSPLAVVIAGGGTGGHLYPGLAVARELVRVRPDAVVSFAGTARGLEARVVPASGFDLDLIRSAGLKGKSIGARLKGVGMLVPSCLDAWRLLTRRRPSVVVGVGGYSSGPVVLLAALRGTPTLVLEQNAVPGLTNRLLSHVVRGAAVTYADTVRYFGPKAFVSGNPVRAEFFGVANRPSDGQARHLLVLGGSQGAHAINKAMAEAAVALTTRAAGVTVAHQTGPRDVEMVREAYRRAGLEARVEAFLDPVVDAIAEADLVICRAGATTLAELAAAGRPAVLIPFPAATDDHQTKNAAVLEQAGAAVSLDERRLTVDTLVDTVVSLLADGDRRRRMGEAARRCAAPGASADIVRRILELAA